MPYDFTFVDSAIRKCADKNEWCDAASERLDREYLLPLERHTASLLVLASDIERFMNGAQSEFEEILGGRYD